MLVRSSAAVRLRGLARPEARAAASRAESQGSLATVWRVAERSPKVSRRTCSRVQPLASWRAVTAWVRLARRPSASSR